MGTARDRLTRMQARGTRGYSFMEVLIAMAIAALLLAIGIPRFTRVRAPYLVAGATRQIEAHVQATRQHAIARNRSYRLNFNVTNNTSTIERLVGGVWQIEGARQQLPAGARLGAITPGNPVIDTRGMLAADVTIPVLATGATTRSVTINVLGRTTIS
jgi:prepilin-type N-terminal cleavage/methylation domain-containing protein